jgi:hypothetical protein
MLSQEIDLHRDNGDDNVQQPNKSASVPSRPLSLTRKRRREMVALFNSAHNHPHNDDGPGNKTATGSAEFDVDLELEDEVKAVLVSLHKKRCGVMKSKPSGNNDAAGPCLQILKGVHATEKDVASEDSEQTSRNDGSANEHSNKLSTVKPPSNASGRQGRVSAWEDHLNELADYHKLYGHCNVPYNYSGKSQLGKWVANQRTKYSLQVKGKVSPMTPSRIKELESLGFEWDSHSAVWEDRLRELAIYRKLHGHCNVPENYSENTTLANWVKKQRCQYRLHLKRKASNMTTYRIQELESLGFECDSRSAAWKDRLSELADYCKIHGHCNVPRRYSENTKLSNWVGVQRKQNKLQVEGKASGMTLSRVRALEGLGFVWKASIGRGYGAPKKPSLGDGPRHKHGIAA